MLHMHSSLSARLMTKWYKVVLLGKADMISDMSGTPYSSDSVTKGATSFTSAHSLAKSTVLPAAALFKLLMEALASLTSAHSLARCRAFPVAAPFALLLEAPSPFTSAHSCLARCRAFPAAALFALLLEAPEPEVSEGICDVKHL